MFKFPFFKKSSQGSRLFKNSVVKVLFWELILFIIGSVLLFFLRPMIDEPLDDRSVFCISRDGSIFDVFAFDPPVGRLVATNASELNRYVIRFRHEALEKSIAPTGRVIKELTRNEIEAPAEKNSEIDEQDEILPSFSYPQHRITYSMTIRDCNSSQILSSETIFEPGNGEPCNADFVYSISDTKLLFTSALDEDRIDEYYLVVKNDDNKWITKKIDFGLNEKPTVLDWEIVKEKSSILFLLRSEKSQTLYVSSYQYENYTTEKTVALPANFNSEEARLRVASGAQYFFVYQVIYLQDKTKLDLVVYNVRDLSKGKEVSLPNLQRPGIYVEIVNVSPDLRYIAYSQSDLYLYDLTTKEEKCVYSRRANFFRSLYGIGIEAFDIETLAFYDCMSGIWSVSFSTDSSCLLAANYLGNAYKWDLQTGKRMQKISVVK